MNHELKILPSFFKQVSEGSKTFEIRDNSFRGFNAGDTISLKEYDPEKGGYTGYCNSAEITYVTSYEQKPNFVVFAFKLHHQ